MSCWHLCTGKWMLCIMCRLGVWLPYSIKAVPCFEGIFDQAGTQMPCLSQSSGSMWGELPGSSMEWKGHPRVWSLRWRLVCIESSVLNSSNIRRLLVTSLKMSQKSGVGSFKRTLTQTCWSQVPRPETYGFNQATGDFSHGMDWIGIKSNRWTV